MYKAKLKSWARVAVLTQSRNATSGARGISLSPSHRSLTETVFIVSRGWRRGGLRAGRPIFPYTFQERRCVLYFVEEAKRPRREHERQGIYTLGKAKFLCTLMSRHSVLFAYTDLGRQVRGVNNMQ
ncbi:hypothetical protein MRX96_020164 [Rhipicephalus microplus]